MSMQTSLARASARAAEDDWRDHKRACATCQPAARRRAWADLCPDGSRIRADLGHARADLEQQRELDRQPVPGQGTLI